MAVSLTFLPPAVGSPVGASDWLHTTGPQSLGSLSDMHSRVSLLEHRARQRRAENKSGEGKNRNNKSVFTFCLFVFVFVFF